LLNGIAPLLASFVLTGTAPLLAEFVLTGTAPLLAVFVPNGTVTLLTTIVLIGTPTLLATLVAWFQNCHNIATHHGSILYSSYPAAVRLSRHAGRQFFCMQGLQRSGYAVEAAVLRDGM
jgi:hypothetical protein